MPPALRLRRPRRAGLCRDRGRRRGNRRRARPTQRMCGRRTTHGPTCSGGRSRSTFSNVPSAAAACGCWPRSRTRRRLPRSCATWACRERCPPRHPPGGPSPRRCADEGHRPTRCDGLVEDVGTGDFAHGTAVLEDHADALAGGDAELRVVRLARAVDLAAHGEAAPGRTDTSHRFMPKIIAFLGYEPFGAPPT